MVSFLQVMNKLGLLKLTNQQSENRWTLLHPVATKIVKILKLAKMLFSQVFSALLASHLLSTLRSKAKTRAENNKTWKYPKRDGLRSTGLLGWQQEFR